MPRTKSAHQARVRLTFAAWLLSVYREYGPCVPSAWLTRGMGVGKTRIRALRDAGRLRTIRLPLAFRSSSAYLVPLEDLLTCGLIGDSGQPGLYGPSRARSGEGSSRGRK